MKTLLLGLLIGIALVCAPAAVASPQADPDSFLATLNSHKITGSPDALLAVGKWVCQEVFENGFGRDQVAQGIIDNKTNTLTMDEAKFYVDTSVKYLCPNGEGVHHGPVRAV